MKFLKRKRFCTKEFAVFDELYNNNNSVKMKGEKMYKQITTCNKTMIRAMEKRGLYRRQKSVDDGKCFQVDAEQKLYKSKTPKSEKHEDEMMKYS